MDIGFIGLGRMGSAMARNLAGAPHAVTGFDGAGITVDGVQVAASPAEAAEGRDVIITMLPNAAAVREVREQCFASARRNALFIDCSTLDVPSAVALAGEAEAAGHMSVDAPVSGGVAAAAAGTLTFMAGGAPEALVRAAPVFEVLGARTVACGGPGSGQAAKLCNNMILGVSMIAVCEAFDLADRLGLERQALFDVVARASGSCWALTAYCPAPGVGPASPADNGYRPGFPATLMLKDLRLAQQSAEAVGADPRLGAEAARLYEAFVSEDIEIRDFSAILPWLMERGRGPA